MTRREDAGAGTRTVCPFLPVKYQLKVATAEPEASHTEYLSQAVHVGPSGLKPSTECAKSGAGIAVPEVMTDEVSKFKRFLFFIFR